MANKANTVGFTGCPSHLELWRKKAAQEAADDRFTVLFHELVDVAATAARGEDIDEDGDTKYADGLYTGLLRAYALITGDNERYISNMVEAAAREPVAEPEREPVPSEAG